MATAAEGQPSGPSSTGVPGPDTGAGETLLKASIGGGAVVLSAAVRLTGSVGRAVAPLGRAVMQPPAVPAALTPQAAVRHLASRGEDVLEGAERALDVVSRELVPRVAEALFDRIDVTEIVLQRVDLDRVIAAVDLDAAVSRVDVDALAARLDVSAVAARIDPAAVAGIISEAVDVNEILRTSTGSVAAAAMRGARTGGTGAYVQVQRAVDRVPLPRRHHEPDSEPEPE